MVFFVVLQDSVLGTPYIAPSFPVVPFPIPMEVEEAEMIFRWVMSKLRREEAAEQFWCL